LFTLLLFERSSAFERGSFACRCLHGARSIRSADQTLPSHNATTRVFDLGSELTVGRFKSSRSNHATIFLRTGAGQFGISPSAPTGNVSAT
jgi:hypothetical protein